MELNISNTDNSNFDITISCVFQYFNIVVSFHKLDSYFSLWMTEGKM